MFMVEGMIFMIIEMIVLDVVCLLLEEFGALFSLFVFIL